ncbi:MAG: hypothetical protein LBB81_02345 [Treponema sp.]|jgi:hypothetical protein|nr:hypothetical protein [Treponema sp.]
MKRVLFIFSAFFLVTAGLRVYCEDPQAITMMPGMRGHTLILNVDARVLDNKLVVWHETNSRVTIPGNSVGIRMVGDNLVILMQFTPFILRNGQKTLVAQGQIWIDIPNEGINYYTSIQTIPIEFNEPVYFFPLGSAKPTDASIEIMLTVNPYQGNGAASTNIHEN